MLPPPVHGSAKQAAGIVAAHPALVPLKSEPVVASLVAARRPPARAIPCGHLLAAPDRDGVAGLAPDGAA